MDIVKVTIALYFRGKSSVIPNMRDNAQISLLASKYSRPFSTFSSDFHCFINEQSKVGLVKMGNAELKDPECSCT